MHTHCNLCDGKNTLEEIVITALEKGFTALGFSSHCHTGLAEDECGMTVENTDFYFREIERLKDKYGDRISLFAGLEEEAEYPFIDERTEYTIESCHFFHIDGKPVALDWKRSLLEEGIVKLGKDRLLEEYFAALLKGASALKGGIVGHFDLYTKFDEQDPLFPTVPDIAFDTMSKLNSMGFIFEVNTGAMSRGYRSAPYPSIPLLKHLKEIGGRVIITSDCHNMDYLDYGFEKARDILLSVGFTKQCYPMPGGFTDILL